MLLPFFTHDARTSAHRRGAPAHAPSTGAWLRGARWPLLSPSSLNAPSQADIEKRNRRRHRSRQNPEPA